MKLLTVKFRILDHFSIWDFLKGTKHLRHTHNSKIAKHARDHHCCFTNEVRAEFSHSSVIVHETEWL